jgi:hypothetical protein
MPETTTTTGLINIDTVARYTNTIKKIEITGG